MKTKQTIAARLEKLFGKNTKRGLVKLGFSYDCGKCSGKGKINAFGHIANGDCFSCGGAGKLACKVTRENIAAIEQAHAYVRLGAAKTFGTNLLLSATWKVRPAAYSAYVSL